MSGELPLVVALMVMAAFIALPAVAAAFRRRASVEASEVAAQLAHFALAVRRNSAIGARCEPLDATLQQRARRLGIPEFASLALALELPQPRPELLADAAQRLALRLKRRVAFERKMLARTASGRRRGAATAATAPLVLLSLRAAGMSLPVEALVFLMLIEGGGCWMLWQLARVEI